MVCNLKETQEGPCTTRSDLARDAMVVVVHGRRKGKEDVYPVQKGSSYVPLSNL